MNDGPLDIVWKLARKVVDEFHGRYGAQVYVHVGQSDAFGVALSFYWNRYHWQRVFSYRELANDLDVERTAGHMIREIDKAMRQVMERGND